MEVSIRAAGPGDGDVVRAAGHVFDAPPRREATEAFLRDPGHHLLLAYDEGNRAVGFVSGVELIHPDKGTEMFLYELGVDPPFRRQGVGRALVAALRALARERGCYGMYTLADGDDVPARATYGSAGGREASAPVMIEWGFEGS
jgi:ribosomal protein S18 acetylase RimI-like enzyme